MEPRHRRKRGGLEGTTQIASVLFADVVGFSKLDDTSQQEVCAALREFADREFGALASSGRCVVKLTGDGLLVVQPGFEPLDRFAVSLQRFAGSRKILLRQGLHSEVVRFMRGAGGGVDAVGRGVNECQRVMDQGQGGHILLSRRYVNDVLHTRDGDSLADLGPRKVKHDTDIHLFNYFCDDPQRQFGNPDTPAPSPWRLPAAGAVGFSLECDEIEVYPRRSHPQSPYVNMEWLKRHLDENGSADVTVIARTARSWKAEINSLTGFLGGPDPRLKLHVVVADPLADPDVLSPQERVQFRTDLDLILGYLRSNQHAGLTWALSPSVQLDSITLVKLSKAGEHEDRVLLDLYTGTVFGGLRPCIVVKHVRKARSNDCLFALLADRVARSRSQAGADFSRDEILDLLERITESTRQPWGTGEPSRKNPTRSLMPAVIPTFDVYREVERYLAAGQSVPRASADIPPPVCVQIEITDACNVDRCLGCTRPLDTPHHEMPVRRFEEIIASLTRMGTRNIVLSGGEPLIHPHICEILAVARDHQMNTAVLTDGLALEADEALVDAVIRSVASLRISMDGVDPAAYRTVRHLPPEHPAFDDPAAAVGRAIDRLAERRSMARGQGSLPAGRSAAALEHVGVCVTLYRANASQVRPLYNWGVEQKIQSLVFKFGHGTPSELQLQEVDFACDAASLRHTESEMRSIASAHEHPFDVNADYVLDFISRMGSDSITSGHPTGDLYDRERLVCFTPLLFSLIAPDSKVYRCCHSFYDNSHHHPRRFRSLLDTVGPDKPFESVWWQTAYRRISDANRWDATAGEILCKCGTRNQCTRHWVHNRDLTSLYRYYRRASRSSRRTMLEEVSRMLSTDPPAQKLWL